MRLQDIVTGDCEYIIIRVYVGFDPTEDIDNAFKTIHKKAS